MFYISFGLIQSFNIFNFFNFKIPSKSNSEFILFNLGKFNFKDVRFKSVLKKFEKANSSELVI